MTEVYGLAVIPVICVIEEGVCASSSIVTLNIFCSWSEPGALLMATTTLLPI